MREGHLVPRRARERSPGMNAAMVVGVIVVVGAAIVVVVIAIYILRRFFSEIMPLVVLGMTSVS